SHYTFDPFLTIGDFRSHAAYAKPYFFGTCEVDKTCQRMLYDIVSDDRSGTRDKVDHSSRKSSFFTEFDKFVRYDRSVGRWFADNRIACDDCGHNHSGKKREREIPRRDGDTDTDRNIYTFYS